MNIDSTTELSSQGSQPDKAAQHCATQHGAITANESGAIMVEFTFSAIAFFMFLIVTFEIGIVGWRSVTVQYIASQTVREAAMFAGNEGSSPAGKNITTMLEYSRRLALNYSLDAQKITNTNDPWKDNFSICELENVGLFNTANAGRCMATAQFGDNDNDGLLGSPEDFIVVRIVLPTRFLLQTMVIEVVGWAAARNEEFGS